VRYAMLFIASLLCFSSCSSCQKDDEPTRVSSNAITLKGNVQKSAEPYISKREPRVRVINIGESARHEDQEGSSTKPIYGGNASLPPETELNDTLTNRLKEKMQESYSDRGTTPPAVDIYTSAQSLEEFSRYYEDRGHNIQRTRIPASQIIAPLLEEKPELRDKISIAQYAGIYINQVIVEGQNISAADKYIDPETYEVINKTFVTVTKK